MTFRPRRSALYMPASNARALEKARGLDADVLIFDLEDAVAPDSKALARQQAAEAVKAGGYGRREVVIRINGLDTRWGPQDVIAAAACAPDAILIPKASSPGDIMMAAKMLRDCGAPLTTRLWAMIETPLALMNIESIARTSVDPAARLDVFVLGTNDLAKETRVRFVPGRAPMLAWFSHCLAAARAHGVDVLDGVYNDIANADGFRAECEQGRDFGMDGKTLIHPGQIAACNTAFSPGEAELALAHKIIHAFGLPENAGKGALQLDGRMVERLHEEMARRTAAIGAAMAERAGG